MGWNGIGLCYGLNLGGASTVLSVNEACLWAVAIVRSIVGNGRMELESSIEFFFSFFFLSSWIFWRIFWDKFVWMEEVWMGAQKCRSSFHFWGTDEYDMLGSLSRIKWEVNGFEPEERKRLEAHSRMYIMDMYLLISWRRNFRTASHKISKLTGKSQPPIKIHPLKSCSLPLIREYELRKRKAGYRKKGRREEILSLKRISFFYRVATKTTRTQKSPLSSTSSHAFLVPMQSNTR